MVNQYPHTLSVETADSPGRDSEGNYLEPILTLTQQPCRVEANDRGRTIVGDDGMQLQHAWTVYLRAGGAAVSVGTLVKVYDGAELLLSATVKRYHRGQLNARIWL